MALNFTITHLERKSNKKQSYYLLGIRDEGHENWYHLFINGGFVYWDHRSVNPGFMITDYNHRIPVNGESEDIFLRLEGISEESQKNASE